MGDEPRIHDLVDRLRGIDACRVNGGAGPPDGKDTFTRKFPASALPPIHAEAADEIERLRADLAKALAERDAAIATAVSAIGQGSMWTLPQAYMHVRNAIGAWKGRPDVCRRHADAVMGGDTDAH